MAFETDTDSRTCGEAGVRRNGRGGGMIIGSASSSASKSYSFGRKTSSSNDDDEPSTSSVLRSMSTDRLFRNDDEDDADIPRVVTNDCTIDVVLFRCSSHQNRQYIYTLLSIHTGSTNSSHVGGGAYPWAGIFF